MEDNLPFFEEILKFWKKIAKFLKKITKFLKKITNFFENSEKLKENFKFGRKFQKFGIFFFFWIFESFCQSLKFSANLENFLGTWFPGSTTFSTSVLPHPFVIEIRPKSLKLSGECGMDIKGCNYVYKQIFYNFFYIFISQLSATGANFFLIRSFTNFF